MKSNELLTPLLRYANHINHHMFDTLSLTCCNHGNHCTNSPHQSFLLEDKGK